MTKQEQKKREKLIRACAWHLRDLQKAHRKPAADVVVNLRGLPKYVPSLPEASYRTSPAAMCADWTRDKEDD